MIFFRPIKVQQICASKHEVCVIDFDGLLWKFGNGQLEIDPTGRIKVRPLSLGSGRKAVQLSAGRLSQ